MQDFPIYFLENENGIISRFLNVYETILKVTTPFWSPLALSRLFPVLPGNGRVTQEDLVVGGYLIPRGVSLVDTVGLAELGRLHWKFASTFRMSLFLCEYL